MKIAQWVVIVVGAVQFAVGYARKSRNLMLAGTLFLVIGWGLQDMARGFMEGWKAG